MNQSSLSTLVSAVICRAIRAKDFQLSSGLILPAVFYMVAYQLWQNEPELFRGAAILDEIVHFVAAGFVASYLFFIIVVLIPRSYQAARRISVARKHVEVLASTIKSFEDASGIYIKDNEKSFMQRYFDEQLYNKQYSIVSTHHLGGMEYDAGIPMTSFIKELARRSQYACDVLQTLLEDESIELFEKIEAVGYRAFRVLQSDYGDMSYPGLMISIVLLVDCFNDEFGEACRK